MEVKNPYGSSEPDFLRDRPGRPPELREPPSYLATLVNTIAISVMVLTIISACVIALSGLIGLVVGNFN